MTKKSEDFYKLFKPQLTPQRMLEMGVVDALKKTPQDNLSVAQKWCSQFNKKAKFLKSGWQRYYYSCN